MRLIVFTAPGGHCPQCSGLEARMKSFGFDGKSPLKPEWVEASGEDMDKYGLRSAPTMLLVSESGTAIHNFGNPSDLDEVIYTIKKII